MILFEAKLTVGILIWNLKNNIQVNFFVTYNDQSCRLENNAVQYCSNKSYTIEKSGNGFN